MALVSVIIPLYNSINFIGATINSVIDQTYKNLELIIVDDHSDDGSFELAKSYESETIKIVNNNKKGACAARNHGFNLSSGDYIQFLDADDLLSPDKIEKQVKLLQNLEDETVASGVWGKFYNNKEEIEWGNQKMNKDYNPAYKWLLHSWQGNGMGQTAIWLTPRKLIEKAGLWNEELKINQDGEFFSRVLLNAKHVVFCKDAKVYYRSGNPGSISQNQKFSKEKAESLLMSYQLYKKHVKDFGKMDELKAGIAQNFLRFIYLFYGQFKELTDIAENEFYSLGYKKMWAVGGDKFRKLASVIGFKSTLNLRMYLGKYI